MKKANSPGRKYKKIHNSISLSWTNVLTVGIILFVLSISVLALKVHYDGGHYYSETSQNHRHFLSRQSSRAINDSPRTPTIYEQRQLKKRSAYFTSNHSTTDDILGSLWVVLSESGLIVRENMEYNSEILGTLTKGAILLGKELIENHSGNFPERLKITFPMVGWISTGARHRDPFILNINIDKDKRCLEEVFQNFVDYVGGDIFPEPVSASSPMECCIHCTLTAGCSSWSHTSENACWLKNTFSRAKPTNKEITSGQFPSRGMVSRRTLNNHMMNPRETDTCCSSDMLSNVSGISSIGVLSLQLGTGLPLGSIGDRLDEEIPSSYVLRQSRSSIDWTQQWPIGTGRFGAMVGGSFDEEIVPLSITNLYVGKPLQLLKKKQPSDAKPQSNGNGNGNSRMTTFKEARSMLSKGEIGKAKKLMRMLQDDNVLSMFQYASDLSLLYSITPIVARSAKSNPSPPRAVPSARAAVMETMRRSLEDILPVKRLGSLHLSQGLLDLRNGITHSSFIYELPDNPPLNAMKRKEHIQSKATSNSTGTPSPATTYTQYREWFASSMDDVIVGSVSCATTAATAGIKEREEPVGCLNMALQLSRQMNPGHGAPVLTSVQISSWPPPGSSPREKQEQDGSPSLSDSTYAISLSFGNEKNNIPFVQVCGAVICDGDVDAVKGSLATDNPDSVKPLLICNNANSLELILSLSMSTTKSTSTTTTTTSPASSCWSTVTSALALGVPSLRSRHLLDFSMKMERVDLSFESFNESSSCPGETLQSRLRSFGSSCQTNGDIQRNGQDSLLVTQSFHYGRYLMLSSGTHAVVNLQGLWADGPTSAWSGDYHLNINLQMAYWAVDVTDMAREVFPPLLAFIKSMAEHGRATAQDLYGCDGWVAHGFTDANFNMGILGDSQWALCVTCGAWLALHLWDHLTYQYDINYLVEDVLPVFRGIATFFLQYMFRGADGHQHTGPTTSPENSYRFADSTPASPILGESYPPLPPHLSLTSNSRNRRMSVMRSMRGGGGVARAVKGLEVSQQDRDQLTPQQLHDQLLRNAIQNDLNQAMLQGQGQSQREAMAAALAAGSLESQEVVEFLTFSPAIDISVLRQVSNAYHICTEWMRLALKGKDKEKEKEGGESKLNYNSSQLLKDTKLAEGFSGIVFGMPGGAVPMVDKGTGLIVEYPGAAAPSASASVSVSALSNAEAEAARPPPSPARLGQMQRPLTANYAMTYEFDLGHRHFSSLHWLYPGTFHPSKSSQSESSLLDSPYMQAALLTMRRKAEAGSGHTSWSAAWQACLWSRLRQSEALWTSLSRLLRKYSSANLLSLHPLLDKVGSERCSTCFLDPSFSADTCGADSIPSPDRGLQTQDGAKFQIDGNLGAVAAISEMLLQSHVAGQIRLLPALPVPLAEKGFLRGLRVRGGGVVSVAWLYGRVSVASLRFDSYHPWLMGMKEGQPGFYRPAAAASHVGGVGLDNLQLEVLSPNPLLLSADPSHSPSQTHPACATSTSTEQNLRSSKRTGEKGISRVILVISQFPCTVSLCASEISPSFCYAELTKLNRNSHLAYEPKE